MLNDFELMISNCIKPIEDFRTLIFEKLIKRKIKKNKKSTSPNKNFEKLKDLKNKTFSSIIEFKIVKDKSSSFLENYLNTSLLESK